MNAPRQSGAAAANQMPDDASVVMVKTMGSDHTMNFVAKRDDALAFQRAVFAKHPEPETNPETGFISPNLFDLEPCSLETYPTPDGRRTTVTVRRGDIVLLCVDRFSGVLPVSH